MIDNDRINFFCHFFYSKKLTTRIESRNVSNEMLKAGTKYESSVRTKLIEHECGGQF